MCNLSDLIVEETTERVTCEKLIEAVENVMESFGVTLERACEAIKTTVEEYEEAKRILSSN